MRWWKWAVVILALATIAALATVWALREADVIRWGAAGTALDRLDALEDREDQFNVVNTQAVADHLCITYSVPGGAQERCNRLSLPESVFFVEDSGFVALQDQAWRSVLEEFSALRAGTLPSFKDFEQFETWLVGELRKDYVAAGYTPEDAGERARLDRALHPAIKRYEQLIAELQAQWVARNAESLRADDRLTENSLPIVACWLTARVGEPLPDCWR